MPKGQFPRLTAEERLMLHSRRLADRTAKAKEKHAKETQKPLSQTASATLTPGQVASMRGRIARLMSDNLEIAGQVLDGTVTWSPTQARVFATLMNKVVPDLSASYHQHEHRNMDLKQMSRADLERIAAGLDEPETIQAEYKLLSDVATLEPTDDSPKSD